MSKHDNNLEAWRDGYLTDMEALRALCSDLGEVESDLEPLNQQREQLREQISDVVVKSGGQAEVRGFGTLQWAPPSEIKSYDTKQLNELIITLSAIGGAAAEIAQQIAKCKKFTPRKGFLRISREKPKDTGKLPF